MTRTGAIVRLASGPCASCSNRPAIDYEFPLTCVVRVFTALMAIGSASFMQLEDYFEFVSADEILLRGTRIGIEAILREYLEGALPESIAVDYPPATLEQVYATITYYLRNQDALDQYLRRWSERGTDRLQRQQETQTPLLQRLIRARAARVSA